MTRAQPVSAVLAPTLQERVVSDTRSVFTMEPLDPGLGPTLGNSLRRTLLSSIPGAAVTSVRIDGVLHEFTTVPGVKEDVTDLLLNLKELVVSSEHDEPVVAHVRKDGPDVVTAGDIAAPTGVVIRNPDLHIATLSGKGRLGIELTVERGRGYVSSVQNKTENHEIGRIAVDSVYSPVLKVTYKVEAARVGQRTDFDRLVLDVQTKPGTTPRDAVASAGRTLVGLFGLAGEPRPRAAGLTAPGRPDGPDALELLSRPLEELGLTTRTINCLKRDGLAVVADLLVLSRDELLRTRNMGAAGVQETLDALEDLGLRLRQP